MSQGLFDTISNIYNYFSENPNQLAGGLGAGLLYQAYGDIGDAGTTGLNLGQALAQTQLDQTQFQPYTVTTGTGSSYSAGPDGQYTMNMSPDEQAFMQNMFGNASTMFSNAMQDTSARETEIFNNMLAAMRPEQERQEQALDRKLAAQGRLGVRSEEFGATPEQLAMAKARAEAENSAMLGAMGQAQREQAQQAMLGQQMLGASYLPQQMLVQGLQPGMTSAAQQQQAQLYGAGLFGEATASGIQALLNAAMGRANMIGTAGSGLLSGAFYQPEGTP